MHRLDHLVLFQLRAGAVGGRHPERFGKGEIEGVAGPESNNSASITAFVSTLTLGIPGDPIMALMLGALVINRLQPAR